MNTDEKVYQPEVITENPFPGGDVSAPVGSATASGIYTPTVTKTDAPFPKKKIAVELLSQAINTRNKKILQEFDLQQSGGFQIGNFENGSTGDLRITPNGLTARDSAGITTFAIDGTTGDAIFRGVIRAGSIITGGTITNEAGDIIIDEEGLVSSNSFRSATVERAINYDTTSTTPVLIPGMSLTTPNLTRSTNILCFGRATLFGSPASGSGDYGGVINLTVFIDGSTQGQPIRMSSTKVGGDTTNIDLTQFGSYYATVGAGTHTIELRLNVSGTTTNFKASGLGFQLTYLILGS